MMIEAANFGVERVKKTLTLAQFHEHISVSVQLESHDFPVPGAWVSPWINAVV